MKPEEREFLVPGARLVASYLAREFRGQIVRGADGGNQYEVEGVGGYSSPSAAANAVVSHANPERAFPNTNGYEFWKFEDVAAAAANAAQPNTATAVVLTGADEIRRAQEAFTSAFGKGAVPINGVRIGYQGGSIEETAYWLGAESVWLASQVAPEGNRFWNAFGTSEPNPGGTASITCEVNSPLEGVNRRVAGCFARATASGHTLLLHRGRIGGGRAGIGANAFWNSYEGAEIAADDDGASTRFALVTDLDAGEVQGDVSRFVHVVERAKRDAVQIAGSVDHLVPYWWVNQGSTHRQEVEGGYLWAPVKSQGGRELAHHQRMVELEVGHRVLHYWAGRIQAVSSVAEAAVFSPIPTELPDEVWEHEGRLAR